MMKISNNSFCFRRIGLLVKRDVMEHWRTFLNITLILTLLFLVIMYSSTWSLFDKDYLGYCIIVQGFCTKVFSFYSIFVLSGILANMQTQGDRINFLMLPASNMEKFLGRLFYVLLLVFVPFVTGFLLADVIHLLISPFMRSAAETVFSSSLIPGFWEIKTKVLLESQKVLNQHVNFSIWVLAMFSCVYTVWESSIYILGGCYWRKHPFLKTFALMMIVGLLATVVMGFSFFNFLRASDTVTTQTWFDSAFGIGYETFLLIGIGVFSVWTILNWYWSYRLFRRSQIV